MATQRNPDPTLIWRKSSLSGADGGCVEVAASELSVMVRDTRDTPSVMLGVSHAQWRRFVSDIKSGDAVSG